MPLIIRKKDISHYVEKAIIYIDDDFKTKLKEDLFFVTIDQKVIKRINQIYRMSSYTYTEFESSLFKAMRKHFSNRRFFIIGMRDEMSFVSKISIERIPKTLGT